MSGNFPPILMSTDPGPGFLPHRLPTADPRRQRLCAGRTDAAGATPHASTVLGGRGWESPPTQVDQGFCLTAPVPMSAM